MRGEASRIADRESRDSLDPKLRDTREDEWRNGNELFTSTTVLDDRIQLESALATALAGRILGAKLGDSGVQSSMLDSRSDDLGAQNSP